MAAAADAARSASSERPTARNTSDTATTQAIPNSASATARAASASDASTRDERRQPEEEGACGLFQYGSVHAPHMLPRRDLVAGRPALSDIPAFVRGRRRRRDRRPQGIRQRLDHLEWLGVDGIWLNPTFPSPNDDWGYDVADYRGVHPDLGTLQDLDDLIRDAGERDIKVLLDLVPNHTSDRHPWFRERPDFYVWSEDGPANNWVSTFGGSAWTKDERTGRHYLHQFAPTQPDLDWWNDAVRDEFDDILRFWFARGVAGFRIDVCHGIVKDRELRDDPPAGPEDHETERLRGVKPVYSANRPEVHDVLRRWRALAEEDDPPRILVGETYVHDRRPADPVLRRRRRRAQPGVQLPGRPRAARGEPAAHDRRGASRPSSPRPPGPSTPAPTTTPAGSPPAGRTATPRRRAPRCSCSSPCAARRFSTTATRSAWRRSTSTPRPRSTSRTAASPRRRTATAAARRCRGRTRAASPPAPSTWLPYGSLDRNVADQRDDPHSTLHLTRDLIELRRQRADLRTGAYATLHAPDGAWAYRRGERHAVALNLCDDPNTVTGLAGVVLAGTDRERDGERVSGALDLRPWEAVVVELFPA